MVIVWALQCISVVLALPLRNIIHPFLKYTISVFLHVTTCKLFDRSPDVMNTYREKNFCTSTYKLFEPQERECTRVHNIFLHVDSANFSTASQMS